MKRTMLVLSFLVIFAMACSNTFLVSTPNSGATSAPAASVAPLPVSVSQPASGGGTDSAIPALFQQVNPGVVAVYAYKDDGSGGLGTGFVVDTEGHIVTNLHVVQNEPNIEVDFPSGLVVPGTVIGQDPDSDIAVIKVDVPADQLHPLTLGDSSLVKVGDPVIAIGNPYGLYSTLTKGIISAKGRTDESLRSAGESGYFTLADMIQTDAAINPGNSGGPLINMQGEVIGINRSILSQSVSAQGDVMNSGLGFAVSSNVLRRVLPSLIASGQYDYPYLGMEALPEIHLPVQSALKLPSTYGVYITGVRPGGPADKAGLRAGTETIATLSSIKGGGDLIMEANGVQVRNFAELISYLVLNTKPGDTITFTVLRGGDTIKVDVVLASRPDFTPTPTSQ
jgi:S1-C subfamily serine protease